MRKKRWVSIFLTLVLLFLQVAPAMAEEIETQSVSGDYSYTLAGDGKVTITAYAGSEESVVIPEQIEGARVTQIAAEAFKGKSVMKTVTIPYGVTSIRDRAFQGCTGLESIHYNCELGSIGNDVFQGCTSLKTIHIGSKVETVWRNSQGTLMGESLESYAVDEANPVLKAEDGVLYKKNGLEQWGLYLYPICRPEEAFETPGDITCIFSYAFGGIKSLKELTITGTNLEVNKSETVVNCPELVGITFGAGVTHIASGVVSGCAKLEEVTFDSNLKYNTGNVISNCNALSTCYVGANVTTFNDPVSGNVEEYVVKEGNKVFSSEAGALYQGTSLLRYPKKSAAESFAVRKGTTGLGVYCFKDCTNLKTIDCGKALETIDTYAFAGCTGIESLVIAPDAELMVSKYVFSGMKNLKSVELIGNTKTINEDAFGNTESLERVVFGKNVTELKEKGRLYYCNKLKEIIVDEANPEFCAKDGVLYNKAMTRILIYPAAKAGETLNIPKSVNEIDENACRNNRNLTEIKITAPVKKIGAYAFENCESLGRVEIAESVTEIGSRAFKCGTIWGVKGSAAEKYANENGLLFVDIQEYEGQKTGTETAPDAGYSDWNGSDEEKIVPAGNTYIVENGAQLAWIAKETRNGNSFRGKKILLAADIDLAGQEWTAIGNQNTAFEGSFDGQGHTISNLTSITHFK